MSLPIERSRSFSVNPAGQVIAAIVSNQCFQMCSLRVPYGWSFRYEVFAHPRKTGWLDDTAEP